EQFVLTSFLQDPQELQDQCPVSSCSPQLGDLMLGRAAQLSASSTCGLDGPHNYCIIGYLEEEKKCFTCDSRLSYNHYNNQNSHRIENIITTFDPERKTKWWQSENGVHQVSIQLDLETVFQFSHLVLSFKSFRPAAMLVERSKDFGRTWKVFRYFAEDCSLHFPSASNEPADSVDDIICDSRYSGSEPSTDGEVVLKALDPVFEIQNPYFSFYVLCSITLILDHFTLGAVRIMFSALQVHGRCVCQHNTAGDNCERCQDFHHDAPWRPGGGDAVVVCRRCNCHGHSDSCHFDAVRFQATGGVSGGVCDSCRHDRMGPQCELCRPFLYRDPQKVTDDPHACRPCDCDAAGSHGGGLCDAQTGQCHCKENVEGRRCDRCKRGFFGLRVDDPAGCHVCRCHVMGSVGSCDQLTGSCECDNLASGPLCDRCLVGFWGLGNSMIRCSPCDCDIGGAHSNMCSPDDGHCHCLPNMIGQRCSDPAPGYFLPSLDYFLYEAELAAPLHGERSPSPTNTPSSSSSLVTHDRPITWTGLGLVRVLEGAGLRFTVDNLPSSSDYQLVIRYETESPSDWLASVSIIMMSPGGRYFVDVIFNKQSESDGSFVLIDSVRSRLDLTDGWMLIIKYYNHFQMGLIPRVESIHSFCSQTDLESFQRFGCVGLAAELDTQDSLPQLCEGLIKSTSARIHNGAVLCRCNVVGSLGPSCTKLGGFCECKQNVIGRCCDTCAPMTFGFGPDGCKPCGCDPGGSVSELCDQVRGQCVCRSEVTGRRCDRCQAGLWGFPWCRPCDCGGLSDVCDQESGVCLDCRDHAAGRRCDRCLEGYYGNPVSRQPCQPCMCPDVKGRGRFFATSCQHDPQSLSVTCHCRDGHSGPRCDRCSPGFYGDLTLPGASCAECPCNNNIDPDDRDACDSLTGECLRCRHDTIGPGCQSCRPGYYGNALVQNCKECSCDRRGTEVTRCPLGSSCFCDARTGQCPCRTGVVGVLCDDCEDGYWNLDGPSGCQPCSCDPVNSFSNICHKVTGQCQCRPEFGGRQCDECGENHFGNPDLQCISCDCNLEGTERPSCDPETGECLCRTGVSGIFCDECSLGYSSAFPACEDCHPCTAVWAESVTDVQRAAQTMRTFIPRHGDDLRPGVDRYRQRLSQMHSELDVRLCVCGLEAACCGLMQICGGPGLDDCSGCGGALCVLPPGRRKCGGPNCDGVVGVTQNVSETTERAKDKLVSLPAPLEESRNKNRLYLMFLTDEMVSPEDIEKMARAVLDIQLPQSPAQIRSMITEINNLLFNTTHLQHDLRNLEEHTKTAHDLLQTAHKLRSVSTKQTDVTEIRRDIYDAEKAQDKANNDLETASRDRDMTKDQIQDVNIHNISNICHFSSISVFQSILLIF
uniref:Laminin subunit beta-1-like n=1 Tax=Scophthalmus maximus TaxID=52904 RepID=A0A8D3E5Z7_SCOMX